MSNISRLFFALVCIVFGYCLHAWLYNYQSAKHPTGEVSPSFALMRRLNESAKLTDSLNQRIAYLSGWKEQAAKILLEYRNKPPRVEVSDPMTVTLTDTVRSTVHITDTFRKSAYIAAIEPNAVPSLRLPTSFKLADAPFFELFGRIDTIGVHLDTLNIVNTIAIQDKPKKTLFREYHSVTFAQSNPYIASITPIYAYSKPTQTAKWFNRIIGFGVGFGAAYGIQQFKK
jgi:hypothetical protein